MKVKFYGVRGSVPTPDLDYSQFGGNTSCIQITFSSGRIAILDAGTGIRNLGNARFGVHLSILGRLSDKLVNFKFFYTYSLII